MEIGALDASLFCLFEGSLIRKNISFPGKIYLLKVTNRNTRIRFGICWRRSGVLKVNFEHISHLFSSVSIAYFEQVNSGATSNVPHAAAAKHTSLLQCSDWF